MRIAGLSFETVYDISIPLEAGRVASPMPGVASFTREVVARLPLSGGALAELSKFEMTAHTGTHIDMPAHFFPHGKRLQDYHVRDFILPAHVVAVTDPVAVRLAHIEKLALEPGDALLFKTRNSERLAEGPHDPLASHVYLTVEAADFCIERAVSLVGIDCHGPERPGETVDAAPIHRRLLGHGRLILEGLDLRGVPPGRYVLFCLPLNMPGGEGSPVRAVLLA